jgi:ABC-type phosphate transport system permease subunit
MSEHARQGESTLPDSATDTGMRFADRQADFSSARASLALAGLILVLVAILLVILLRRFARRSPSTDSGFLVDTTWDPNDDESSASCRRSWARSTAP